MTQSKVKISESGPVDAVTMDLVSTVPDLVLELKIIEERVGFITTNAKDLLIQAQKKCEEYKDVARFIGNEDLAKKERAALNNAEKKAAELAKEVTSRWNEPLEEFASTMKEVRAAFKAASNGLDACVKEAEQKKNEQKTLAIRLYFDTKKFDLVEFERLFNPRWLLKGAKMPDIMKEIDEKIEKIYGDIKILERIPDYGTPGKAFYLKTLDINLALAEVDSLKAAAEKIAREKVEREEREVAAQVVENQKTLQKEDREEREAEKSEAVHDLAAEALGIAEVPEPEKKGDDFIITSLRIKIKHDTYRDLRQWLSSRGVPYKTVSLFDDEENAGLFMRREGIAGRTYTAVIH